MPNTGSSTSLPFQAAANQSQGADVDCGYYCGSPMVLSQRAKAPCGMHTAAIGISLKLAWAVRACAYHQRRKEISETSVAFDLVPTWSQLAACTFGLPPRSTAKDMLIASALVRPLMLVLCSLRNTLSSPG
ncbi:hypothetical protein N7456_009290 [Penicillium angulare]|uniref:Uncharacterized protein n=1 Tax=Penicillium angulare TaxID=116970 RepID=A0A9W9F4F7_9EURO|nr:hypothetical protein N7456_009290 [Penicillium angulare]